MCLICKKALALVAERDLTCYKVVEFFEKKWVSPYKNIPQEFLKGRVIETRKASDDFVNAAVNSNRIRTGRYGKAFVSLFEGIHSYINLEEIIETWMQNFLYFVRKRDTLGYHSYRIIKCTIPKGTLYFEGIFSGNGAGSYSSARVIMEEVVFESNSMTDIHKLLDEYEKYFVN